MRHGGGLRRLRVRVRRHDCVDVPAGQIDEARTQRERGVDQLEHELALTHPVHRHVDVVPAAGRVQPAGHVIAARSDQQPFDVEEEVFVRPVVVGGTDLFDRELSSASRRRCASARRACPLRKHDEMRAVDRQQRREEQRLRVLEILGQDVVDVFGRKRHRCPPSVSAGQPGFEV